MIVYAALVVYLALLGIAFSSMRKGPFVRGVFALLSFGAFAVIMGLRAPTVGIDTAPYEGYYTRIGLSDDFMHIVNAAPVYSLFNKALYLICPDPQFLVICCSLIICGGVAFFAYHCSRNVLWSAFFYLTFYFFCNAMNGMRQAVAMALCLVAFTVVLKWRKWLVALLLSIMAAGVHVTCLIFAPFVFAPLLRLTKETFARLSVAIVVVIVVGSVSIKLLLALFSTLFPGYYGQYIDILLGDAFAASGKNLIQTAFYAVLLFAFYWMCVRERHDREARALFLPVLCGLALSTVFFQNYLLGARIPLYCTVVLIAIVPNMLERLGKTKMAVASGLVFVSLSLLFILLSGNYAGVVPYEMVV